MTLHYEIGIVAHVDRLAMAEKLADTVNPTVMCVDDGEAGCTGNHLRAWKSLKDRKLGYDDWAVVLEDDAVPVKGFNRQVALALSAAPTKIVSFYLGTGNPIHWQNAIKHAVAAAESWIVSEHLIHCVGYAIRSELISDMIKAVDDGKELCIDERITAWARQNRHLVGYTCPSLVDHADGPSVIGAHPDGNSRNVPRHAWKTGTREHWRGRPVLL